MAENEKPKTDYSSNSERSKKQFDISSDRPNVKAITTASSKKSLGKKFRETFAGDDAGSVGQYVLFDVIIPRLKDMLFDTISQGSERALFGSQGGRRSTGRRNDGKTDYSGMSRSRTRDQRDEPRARDLSRRERANHDFSDIVIASRADAEMVRDQLIELIDQYEQATVADFYSSVDISAEHTDIKWGWTDLTEARIMPARGGGFILDLPDVEQL